MKDTRDPCAFAYFSDESGRIYVGEGSLRIMQQLLLDVAHLPADEISARISAEMKDWIRDAEQMAGGVVNDRTGLKGWFSMTLNYSMRNDPASADSPGDAPNIFTAVQEQLGLKLQPEKVTVPVFVVDHIERPTPD